MLEIWELITGRKQHKIVKDGGDFLRKSRVVAQLMNELANKLAQSVKTQDFKSLQHEKING
jgi:hypothetical protein